MRCGFCAAAPEGRPSTAVSSSDFKKRRRIKRSLVVVELAGWIRRGLIATLVITGGQEVRRKTIGFLLNSFPPVKAHRPPNCPSATVNTPMPRFKHPDA